MASFLDKLPVEVSLPPDGPARRRAIAMRWVALLALANALAIPVVQYQVEVARTHAKMQAFLDRYGGHPPQDIEWPRRHWGAMGRWCRAVVKFWEGRNIYLSYDAHVPGTPRGAGMEAADEGPGGEIWLHPNMPFTVLLLTPFAYMSPQAAALDWNLLKIAVLLGTLWMLAGMMARMGTVPERRLLGDCTRSRPLAAEMGTVPVFKQRKRVQSPFPPDWLIGLALIWCLPPIILDLQHGNTNLFVLGAIVLHLWLFHRGRSVAAGAALALAICLKMTPAIFLLYWLYQRNWRLLAGAAGALALALTVFPMAACVGIAGGDFGAGLAHWRRLTGTWLSDVILPGLLKGATYPTHINQSLTGLLDRLFLAGPDGNIFYNPEDNSYADQKQFGWITLAELSPSAVRWVVRVVQGALVGLLAWAIGWRRLGRDDPRRMLHYGLVVLAMLILNQRTWDHHAAVGLIPALGIWWAVFSGATGVSPVEDERGGGKTGTDPIFANDRESGVRPRFSWRVAVALVIVAGLLLWSTGNEPFVLAAQLAGHSKDVGRAWADGYKAYGPTFWHFALMLAAGLILARTDRRQWAEGSGP